MTRPPSPVGRSLSGEVTPEAGCRPRERAGRVWGEESRFLAPCQDGGIRSWPPSLLHCSENGHLHATVIAQGTRFQHHQLCLLKILSNAGRVQSPCPIVHVSNAQGWLLAAGCAGGDSHGTRAVPSPGSPVPIFLHIYTHLFESAPSTQENQGRAGNQPGHPVTGRTQVPEPSSASPVQ